MQPTHSTALVAAHRTSDTGHRTPDTAQHGYLRTRQDIFWVVCVFLSVHLEDE